MVFSICEWGSNKPWKWGGEVGNLWRTTGDIYHRFDGRIGRPNSYSLGVLQILDMQEDLRKYAGPGHWNDPDMLEVGNGMTVNEDRAHFSMWCMLAAPLISGNDLRYMSRETAEILMNKDAIAVDQDKLGIEGFQYSSDGVLEVWFKPLADGDWAMCVLDRSIRPQKVRFDWKKEKVSDDLSKRETRFDTTTYKVRDLWTKKDMGTTEETLNTEIMGHDVLMLRLSKQ